MPISVMNSRRFIANPAQKVSTIRSQAFFDIAPSSRISESGQKRSRRRRNVSSGIDPGTDIPSSGRRI
jgi:hypothetical protein